MLKVISSVHNSRILRVKSLSWSLRHGYSFLGAGSLANEMDELSARAQMALEDIGLPNRPWIISSAIDPELQQLSYSKVRSVFSPKERANQTKETIESIQSLPGARPILVVDSTMRASEVIERLGFNGEMRALEVSDLPSFVLADKSPFKGLSEALTLLGVSGAPALSETGLWKISGRYSLSKDSVANEDPKPEGITATVSNNAMNTTCYSVCPTSLPAYRGALQSTFKQLLLGVSLEVALLDKLQGSTLINPFKRMGVSGLIAVNGERFDN